MDKGFIARGIQRCSTPRFLLWIAPWAALLVFGLYAAGLCLVKGLNQTNMDNRFAFGLWIFLDLTVIALGAGAFFTGFLLYILRLDELRAVINSAVVIGLVCYSGAVCVLAVDVGQPLRAWFTFWYPNVHSMLTEVTFCISCYLTVLAIEYVPILLKNRKLRQAPSCLVFEFELHKLMYVLAGVGTFLSFFHQGSLGGLYGVLRGRPFAFREGLALWPTTFFLFILSAAAVGPSFILLTTKMVEGISKKSLVRPQVLQLLGRISGLLLSVYVLLKTIDTLVWINRTSPESGFVAAQYYSWTQFGTWILFAEIVLFGLAPALILLTPRLRARSGWLVSAAALACCGVALNRYVLTVQTLALPTLSFDRFLSYTPSWQETGTFLAVVAFGVLVYSFSFRYLQLFPEERELKARTMEEEEQPVLAGGIDMLPWNYGFEWNTGHVVFLGAFYTVLVVVATTVVSAALRSRRAIAEDRAEQITWRSDFHDLSARDRACRHAMTGELKGRECHNSFDCGHCEMHAKLLASRPPACAVEGEEEIFGMEFPLDRLYHRGHTWAHPQADGTVTVGLDELGSRLLGVPDAVDLPRPGMRVNANGTAFRLHKRDADVRVLSPVDGEVVETGGPDRGWYLRVKPDGTSGFGHLLSGAEIKPWLMRELERLQLALAEEGAAPTLADGGVLVADIGAGYPRVDWDAVCGKMFLEP